MYVRSMQEANKNQAFRAVQPPLFFARPPASLFLFLAKHPTFTAVQEGIPDRGSCRGRNRRRLQTGPDHPTRPLHRVLYYTYVRAIRAIRNYITRLRYRQCAPPPGRPTCGEGGLCCPPERGDGQRPGQVRPLLRAKATDGAKTRLRRRRRRRDSAVSLSFSLCSVGNRHLWQQVSSIVRQWQRPRPISLRRPTR